MKGSGGKGVRGCQSLTATHKDQGFEDWKEGVRRNRRARSLGGGNGGQNKKSIQQRVCPVTHMASH